MEICAIICEFNPFHNGHKYLIERAKELSGCDRLVCIMSGSFTQRGDVAVFDKFTRAKHAVYGGADCVIELPSPFAVAPAEIFAKGAVKLLSSVPQITSIAFGCEETADFITIARDLSSESDRFRTYLNKYLAEGMSYAKSYSSAYAACGGEDILSSPNNILAAEYAKAVLNCGRNLKLLPVKRIGGGYNDAELKENYSSASAIRSNIRSERIKSNLPDYVYADCARAYTSSDASDKLLRYALSSVSAERLQDTCGCSEGLENRLKDLCALPVESIIAEATNKRYPSSRIKRILTANMLNIRKSRQNEFLSGAGYIKPLAVKKECARQVLGALARSEFPTVIKQRDLNKLNYLSQQMFLQSAFCDNVRDILTGETTYNFTLQII